MLKDLLNGKNRDINFRNLRRAFDRMGAVLTVHIKLVRMGPNITFTRMEGYTVEQVNRLLREGIPVVFHEVSSGYLLYPSQVVGEGGSTITVGNVHYANGNIFVHAAEIGDNSFTLLTDMLET